MKFYWLYHWWYDITYILVIQGQNQSGGTGGRGDGKKDDKVNLGVNLMHFSLFSLCCESFALKVVPDYLIQIFGIQKQETRKILSKFYISFC